MQMKKLMIVASAFVLTTAITAIVSVSAFGNMKAAPSPATVAVIDLERVFAELDELSSAQVDLNNRGQDMTKLNEEKLSQLKMLEDNLSAFAAGTPAMATAEEELLTATIEYETWVKVQERLVDREKALVLEKVYNSVKQAVASMAEQEGYDLVLLNDSIKPLMRGPEQAVQQQISARRILYANNTIDVTEELITRMNNMFNAGGGAQAGANGN